MAPLSLSSSVRWAGWAAHGMARPQLLLLWCACVVSGEDVVARGHLRATAAAYAENEQPGGEAEASGAGEGRRLVAVSGVKTARKPHPLHPLTRDGTGHGGVVHRSTRGDVPIRAGGHDAHSYHAYNSRCDPGYVKSHGVCTKTASSAHGKTAAEGQKKYDDIMAKIIGAGLSCPPAFTPARCATFRAKAEAGDANAIKRATQYAKKKGVI